MTLQALHALEASEVIIGYTVYIDLVKDAFDGKQFLTTPMRQERRRCEMAFEQAQAGKTTAMICSGDAGVYGMAGLILEIGEHYPDTEVEVIPGVTAALGGAAVLGAPLMHDFCVISLSDLMTSAEKIDRRIRMTAEADFVICLYNPSSRSRKDSLRHACGILLECLPGDRVCAVARNVGREGEAFRLLPLGELADAQTDMFCVVYIGNSQTKIIGGRMVTPRGYQL